MDRGGEEAVAAGISVFGRLIREGRLTKAQLEGLSQDKLESIRRVAAL